MNDLDEFMNKVFPSLELKSPLFYNSPIAIRFNLGGNFFQEVKEEQIEEVIRKTLTLFKAINNNDDEIFIITFVDYWAGEQVTDLEEGLFKTFNKVINSNINYTINKKQQNYRYDDDEDVVTCRYWTKIKVSSLNSEELFKIKVNSLLHYNNFVGDLYIVNYSNNTIFHMYDERGLDIVSKQSHILTNVYRSYESWILEYDRKYVEKKLKDILY